MGEKELQQLREAIRAELRPHDQDLPETAREQLIQERLPGLLKARYAAPDVSLSDETKQTATARLMAAARERHGHDLERAQRSDLALEQRPLGARASRPHAGAEAGAGEGVPAQRVDLGARDERQRRPGTRGAGGGPGPALPGTRPRPARLIGAVLGATVLMLASVVGWRLFAGRDGSLPVTLIRAPAGAQVPEGLLDPTGVLHLTYGRGENGYYVQARDGGRNFAAPIRLNRHSGRAMVGGERGPKLAYGREGVIHVVWMGEGPHPQGVWYTRSTDSGRSFEPERNLLDTKTGCDSATVAADSEGNVWIFWLDGRLPSDPKSPLASPIFMARSTDNGHTFSRNQRVRHDHPGLACECCQLIARVGADDHLYLSFRSGYQNIRDAYLLKGPKAGNDFRSVRVSQDDWLFAG